MEFLFPKLRNDPDLCHFNRRLADEILLKKINQVQQL